MSKRILITGATDGIGLATAKMLAKEGHQLIVHGRNSDKLDNLERTLKNEFNINVESYVADFSNMKAVKAMAESILSKEASLDVLINNAGVYMAGNPRTEEGLDLRFAVNTYAPYLLTVLLLHLISKDGRVINLSSAAQSSVNLEALKGTVALSDNLAYAQSKLALTMWSIQMGRDIEEGPQFIAVNPKSFLGSKMVREAYGREGHDISIGGEILMRAALSDEFADATGKYYDNDMERFSNPHPDALDEGIRAQVIGTMEAVLSDLI